MLQQTPKGRKAFAKLLGPVPTSALRQQTIIHAWTHAHCNMVDKPGWASALWPRWPSALCMSTQACAPIPGSRKARILSCKQVARIARERKWPAPGNSNKARRVVHNGIGPPGNKGLMPVTIEWRSNHSNSTVPSECQLIAASRKFQAPAALELQQSRSLKRRDPPQRAK